MGGSNQLFRIGTLLVLEPCPERIGGIRENAGIGGKIAGAGTARTALRRIMETSWCNVTAILREGDGVQLRWRVRGKRRCHHAAITRRRRRMRAAPSLGQKMRSRRENQERHLQEDEFVRIGQAQK